MDYTTKSMASQRLPIRKNGKERIFGSKWGLSPLKVKYLEEKSPSNSPQKRIDGIGVEWHKYPCTTIKPRSHFSL
jgi:hypothetical protein